MNRLLTTFDEPIQIERQAAGAYVDGNFVDGDIETLEARAAVLPMKPTEIKLIAPGQEDAGGIAVYSDTPLMTANEATQTKPDVILWDARRWVVFSAANRPQIASLAHYKAIALLEDVG